MAYPRQEASQPDLLLLGEEDYLYQNLTPIININSYQELMSIGQEASLEQT